MPNYALYNKSKASVENSLKSKRKINFENKNQNIFHKKIRLFI